MRSLTELLLVTVGCGVAAFPFGNDNATDKTAPSQQAKAGSQATSADWPQFRGPDGQGHSNAKDLALTWSETSNIKWKRAIEGTAWSSPVIQDNQIWLTSATEKGKTLVVICLDRVSGRQLHHLTPFSAITPVGLHSKNSYASPTPIIEGNRIYVHFGPYGTACLETNGKVVWKTRLPHKTYYGPSSSPVLIDDLLIVQCHGTDVRFVTALDKKTGKARWTRTHEALSPKLKSHNSESTPLVIQTATGRQLICNVAGHVLAYDPLTGESLWSVRQQENYAQVPRPVFGHDLVFTAGGYFSPVVFAIRPAGTGDITESHVVWSVRKAVPNNPSPLLVGDELYMVSDKGIASCLDARTGALRWRERLGGNFSASPISADGRIYFFSEEGVTTVLAPGRHFRKLATNKLDGQIMASPAISGTAIYLRTDQHLYCIDRSASP